MSNSKKKMIIDATKLIGRESKYIRRALKDEMIASWGKTMMVRPLKSERDDKGRVIATTRLLHFCNSAMISYKIALGLFDEDEDFAMGVATASLYHDLGQPPFGHDGEAASTYASKESNGGPRLHNIEGTMKILYRYSDKIKDAINSGRIIYNESKKRNISEEELKQRIENGMEPEISRKIEKNIEKNEDLSAEAIKILAMCAGNHNGERGTSNIKPDLSRTFEDFYTTAVKTYIDATEDRNMVSCNIVDAIVKISDQISSITYDIVDAKRAGIEDDIFIGWAEPIATILGISEEEARKKLKGNNKELAKLAMNLQEKFVESVIESSTEDEIKMDLAPLLYGITDEEGQTIKNGLRTFNMTEHTAHTSTAETETILNNAYSRLTDILSQSILEKNGRFPPKLNEIFRLSGTNQLRRTKKKILLDNYKGNGNLRRFYEYVTDLSSEEYRMNKKIIKESEVQYYRKMIEDVQSRRIDILYNIEPRSPRNTTKYLIEEYMLSPGYEAMKLGEDNRYSDEEVKNMVDRVNGYLSANPIEGITQLQVLVQKHNYQLGEEGESERIPTKKVRMNTDQQIAARIAISYLNTLSDEQFINLAFSEKVITQEEKDKFYEPYRKTSTKRNGGKGHKTEAMKKAVDEYKHGSCSCLEK